MVIDHYPECIPHIPGDLRGDMCICDRLRACEARVSAKWEELVDESSYRKGYAEALKEAFGVVESQQQIWREDTLVYMGLGIAKEAIKELKEAT